MISPARTPFTVLTLHPDPLVRSGVVASLRAHPGFDAIDAEADDLAGRPVDVVIADDQQAMQLCNPAQRAGRMPLAGARILVLTANDREATIRKAIEAGVAGYLLFGCPLSELVEGVTTVAQGGRFLGRAVAQRMADSMTRMSLTGREADVLRFVVAGESNKVIARSLRIEVGTVKTHMSAILSKLNARSRTQAAAIAIQRGLVEDGEAARREPAAQFA
jgi:DNA-binding NarL/FixJ family response regulator